MPERLVTILPKQTCMILKWKLTQQYGDKAWQQVAHIGRYLCQVIKHEQTGQTTHLQWREILTYRSIRQYECSHRLEFIITVLHFGFRGSSMHYTCIIAFTGSLVGSSNPVQQIQSTDPVQQSSPPIQSSNPVHRSSPRSSPVIRDSLWWWPPAGFLTKYVWTCSLPYMACFGGTKFDRG